jgi:hypothetical protein
MNNQLTNVLFVFKMLMSIVYVTIGLTLILKSNGIGEIIPAQYAPVLGILLIIYGIFRGYRAYTIERKK